mmetsp:Transcript_35853/g.92253  ORF Transcript_35853/g.92253 Transcript_35853/m.92253 type:complete len:340 (-) Transcript_35853:300-1319(-)
MEPAGPAEARSVAPLLVLRDRVVLGDGDVPAGAVLLQHGGEAVQLRGLARKAEAEHDLRAVHAKREYAHPPQAVPCHVDLHGREEIDKGGSVREGRQGELLPLEVRWEGHHGALRGNLHGVPLSGVRILRHGLHGSQGALVHRRCVVRFACVLHQELPVAVHSVLSPSHADHALRFALGSEPRRVALRQVAKRLAQRGRVVADADEDEAVERLDAHGPHADLLLEVLCHLHAWCPLQRAVEVVCPGVVWTYKAHLRALAHAALHHLGPPVAADVRECVELAIVAAADCHGSSPLGVDGEVAAGLRHLILAPDQAPGGHKDAVHLALEPFRRVVALPGQC